MLPFGKNLIGSTDRYSSAVMFHDFAWSIFILKLGVWLYAFFITLYMLLVTMWITVFVVIILVLLALMALFACMTACEGGAGGLSVGEAASCGSCNECCAFELCSCCGPGVDTPALLYLYNPAFMPHGTAWGPGDCACHRCGCCRGTFCWSCLVFTPCLRFLVGVFPHIPENMLGGVVGWYLGTHPRRNNYDPRSPIVRLFASPCWSLANRSEGWRLNVYQWLHERDAFEITAQAGMTVAEPRREADSLTFGDVCVEPSEGMFTVDDRIFNFEDYHSNRCWICQDSSPSWDLWVSCRHSFCQRCSSEMLRRRMPCPLCRVRSTRIDRRRNDVLEEMEEGSHLLTERTSVQQESQPVRRDNSNRPGSGLTAVTPQQMGVSESEL